MIYRFLFIVCLIIEFNAYTQSAPRLSDQAQISLLTCSPGKALYEAFGHSAIRIYDPVRNLDRAYNFGTFDFDQPNFYGNFAMGNLIYMLSVNDSRRFINYYIYFDRAVYQDVLDLTQEEKQSLFEALEINYLPENRYYNYDYFYDNCATRIRDMVAGVLGDKVTFDSSHITTSYTIRQLVDLYMAPQPWGDLAIDLPLGLPMDKVASPHEYMFLPDYLQLGFENAYVKRGDSLKALVAESIILNEAPPELREIKLFTPLNVFWTFFLFVAILTFFDWRRKKISTWFDMSLLIIVGVLGTILAFISFFTDHKAAAHNFNLLWAIPFHLPVGLLLPFRKKIPGLKYYFLTTAALTLFLMISNYLWLPQQLHYSLMPLMLALVVRLVMLTKSTTTGLANQ